MKTYQIPYGKTSTAISISEEMEVDLIAPPHSVALVEPINAIRSAIQFPVSGGLHQMRSAGSVSIAINDKTRPVPHHLLLPPLLDELESEGIDLANVTIFTATGTHVPMSKGEIESLLPGDVLKRVRVVSHDVDQVSNFFRSGFTSRGTPIEINRRYYESDLRIVVGEIELHHFAGFSGGVKSAVIGLGSREAIQQNHRMLTDEKAVIGCYDDNPLRQDIEEAGEKIGIHFALNAVLNENKQPVAVFFGRPRDVMQKGILVVRNISAVPMMGEYDLVIASAGGYPKDINFYQAQKAISHACLFAKKGGRVILVAECCEGSGSRGFENFIRGLKSTEEIFRKFSQTGFVVGPHKAVQLARQLETHKVMLYSSMDADIVRGWLVTPVVSVEDEVHKALAESANSARIAILPYATGVFPLADEE